MDNRPIGVFDSGLGGLTAVKELIRLLPNEDIIYFGDTGRVPYGNRSYETIIRYAKQDINFLAENNVKCIVAACGTVSCVAENIDYDINVPYTGVVLPTCRAAVNETENKRIAVIGTSATIKSNRYEKELKKLDNEVEVYSKECPLFVPLVENGFIHDDNQIAWLTVKHYLDELKDNAPDTLILGCTHYPLLKSIISKVMGKNVKLIDPGMVTAIYTKTFLEKEGLITERKEKGSHDFYVSDSTECFKNIANKFLGDEKDMYYNVRQIDIERF
jgi:glutamate racemase